MNSNLKGQRYIFFYKKIFLLFICLFLISCIQTSPTEKDFAQKHEKKYSISQGLLTARVSRFISHTDETFEKFDFWAMFPRYNNKEYMNVMNLLDFFIFENQLSLGNCIGPEPVFVDTHNFPDEKQYIKLVDAGSMHIWQNNVRHQAVTRTFPDLLKVIDGVVYTKNTRSVLNFVPGQSYTLNTSGSDEVGPFEVVLNAPNDLGEILVNDTSPSETMISVLKEEQILFEWEGAEYGDEIVFRMDWTAMGLPWMVQCRMKDEGKFELPLEISEQVQMDSSNRKAEVSFSRIRQVFFAAPGLTSGEFSYIASTGFLMELL